MRHPTEIPIEVREGERRHATPMRDVSVGGLRLGSDVEWPPGTILAVRVPTVEPSFEARARVVWCAPSNQGYEVGVEFMDVDEAFRARMVEQICHIEAYRKRVEEKEGRRLEPDEAAEEWIRRYAPDFP